MSRTESPEEVGGLTSRNEARSASVAASAAAAGKWGAKLAAYAVATVAITFVMLRPRRAGSNNRGSLFLGSGVIMVLIKTLLSVSEGAANTPAPAPTTPILAAATPSMVQTPVNPPPSQPPAPTRKHQANSATVSQSKPVSAEGKTPKPTTYAAGATAAPPPAAKPVPAGVTRVASALGTRYADRSNGFSVQFPAGWANKPFRDGGCWVLESTDGQGASITVGFSKYPANRSVDEVVPAKITRNLQQRAGTVVHATGYATLAGRRSLWHKYTGPISRPDGTARMTVVHYWLPLQDGRALEVRLAALPDKFNDIAPRMKQSLDSFKLLLPAVAEAR